MSFNTVQDMARSMRTQEKGYYASERSAPPPEPPPYHDAIGRRGSRWSPRNWARRTVILAVIGAIIVLIAIIVGAVEGVRANRYPDYIRLNYRLEDTYSGTDFFSNFEYFNQTDPAGGFAIYIPEANAQYTNLTYASSSSATLKVDTAYTNTVGGRNSVRVSSKKQYNSGLFIFDVIHSPYGCGTWPALWLVDETNWPAMGEIDIMEMVNTATTGNQMTLHTSKGCTMGVKRKETGKVLQKDCWNVTNSNAGCGVQGPPATYGEEFNNNGGGVYAMELRTEGIRIWFFPRSSLPADISSNSSAPDPSTWGTALADFPKTDCDIGHHFGNLSIIANIDLCGPWAGSANVFNQQDNCPGDCKNFVATNNTAFETAYWEFASFKVFSSV
ncbi:MAG: hypothetical protein M1820_003543 [Bogoriella megaspora]|nr:MAG: hypothetical protein M1820_003543 [Bogoriella megaspora]